MNLKSLECSVAFCLEEIDIAPPDLSKIHEAWGENYDIDFKVYLHPNKLKIYLELRTFRNPGRSWMKVNWIEFARALESGEIPEILESSIERVLEEI